ncbi:major facilitator superfamily domain-containing protein [Aspergillus granulosus]|uniref:Major facilitator superfamily domain-containing protein n=1 Tax=Aspergillus granulosus TaxID=176169 RepID=A0ABR4H1U7_9EURO
MLTRLWPHGEPTRPFLIEWRASKGFIIFVVCFAVFTDILLYGIIVPVTPTALNERAGVGEDDEQRWTSILLGLYGGALLAFSPPAGYLADRIESRRWPLIAGLVALGASTALLCVGTHIGLWIAGRLCQGASAAVVWTVGCALLVDTVDKDGLGQALGYIGMGMTFGAMGGPLIGGVLYEHGGYYSVYALAFALIALDIVFRVVMVERKHAVRWLRDGEGVGEEVRRESEKRAVPGDSASPDVTTSNPDLECQKDSPGPSESPMIRPSAGNSTTPEPTPQPAVKRKGALYTLLASSRILVCLWAYFILSLLLTSFDSVLPLFVEETFHWQQTAQGLVFIPLTIPHLIDPVIGFINDRYPSSRRYIASGAFFAAVPALTLLRFVKNDSTQHIVLLFALLALVGLCLASMLAILLVEVSYVVREKEEKVPEVWGKGGAMALAYGVLNSAFAGGSLVGPFLAGFIRESSGWGAMAWVLALVIGITGIPVLLLLGGFLFEKREEGETLDDGAVAR